MMIACRWYYYKYYLHSLNAFKMNYKLEAGKSPNTAPLPPRNQHVAGNNLITGIAIEMRLLRYYKCWGPWRNRSMQLSQPPTSPLLWPVTKQCSIYCTMYHPRAQWLIQNSPQLRLTASRWRLKVLAGATPRFFCQEVPHTQHHNQLPYEGSSIYSSTIGFSVTKTITAYLHVYVVPLGLNTQVSDIY